MQLQQTLDEIIRVVENNPDEGIEPFEDALAVLTSLSVTDKIISRAYSRYIRILAENNVKRLTEINASQGERLMEIIQQILALNASSDFDSYMLFMEWNRDPEKQFYRPRRHVLYTVVRDLQDLADDKICFLAISLPPRVGKSTLCIFFLTFIMGRYPLKANVMSGYSDKLTSGFHTEALSIIRDSYTYRFAEVFPEAKLVDSSKKDETISLLRKGRFPTLTCRSIDGTLTGAVEVGCGALLYCDDLVSDREEALSNDRMDKLYQAYLNQLKDRMNDGAKQLFVGTRWVPNDPIGRIEEDYEGDPKYRFTTIPALNEEGETNFDYLYHLGFSTQYYEDMRNSLDRAGEHDSWMAKYMASPEYIGGLMFSEDQLKFYEDLPEDEPDAIIAACDTKDKGKDYAALPIAFVYGDKFYIHNVICDNSLPEIVEPRIVEALISNKVNLVRFESNSAGGRIADDIKEECEKRGHDLLVKKKFSTENKETRILVDSLWIKTHCLFRKNYPDLDYGRFMRMLTHYTTEGKNKHDDAPDAMSMLKRLANSVVTPKVKAVRRPW